MKEILENLAKKVDLEKVNSFSQNTLISNLGIKITTCDETGLWGEMVVSEKNCRPFGGLHGGATAAFAETLGSLLSFLIEDEGPIYGLELSVNHLKKVNRGEKVIGHAAPLHLGRTTHVHEIKFFNLKSSLVAVSRLTVYVVAK